MNWQKYQQGLYEYYRTHTENPLGKEAFLKEVKDYTSRSDKYIVYYGYSRKDSKKNGKVVYIGTTIQHPMSRWFYHSIHQKNLNFVEMFRFDNEYDMLEMEYKKIRELRPAMNKIKNRQQNFNVMLTQDVIELRKGNPEWCQCCLRRHVNKGYRYCYFCSTGNN